MANPCLFCGASGASTLSNEHVIPQWLLEHLELPADDQMFQGVASSATDTLVDSPRIHSSFNFVQGHVCKECNNGWMSRLEAAAKPILTSLIEQERTLDSLKPEEANIVGKWVIKTAYMISWASPLKRTVQLEHLQALCGDDGQPSSGVSVFGMQSDFKEAISYYQRGFWRRFYGIGGNVPNAAPREAYKIGLQLRHLYMLAAFWPDAKSALTVVKNLHIPIFPGEQQWPAYAIKPQGNGDPEDLASFVNSLAICHP
jgi:hypothetical protein